ncbi:MAG: hypothetical protein HYT39_02520 [Candidatus Sungbacteria bacterium]|nr:hypothetical protein [Candidatus Sungbacteria bacterium]
MAITLSISQFDSAPVFYARRLQTFLISPFFLIISISLLLTAAFYGLVFAWKGILGVILGTTLFAQTHFILGYAFAFNRLKERTRSSYTALGIYALFLGGTALLYPALQGLTMTFWGVMAILGYFFLHYYENILYFWDVNFGPPVYSRRPLYFLMSATAFLALLPFARLFGPQFAGAAISYQGVNNFAFLLSASAIIFFAALLFRNSSYQKSGGMVMTAAALVGAIVITILIASYFLNFLGIAYLIVIWHFFMWHIFYFWKLWRRAPGLSLWPSFIREGRGPLNLFLAYATSGVVPFTAATALVAAPILTYFMLSYDGARSTFLFNPFYGQFAMFVWAVPHITLSFVIRR